MFVDRRLGNAPVYHLKPPQDYNMRIPDAARNCVVFLVRPRTPGNLDVVTTCATGFLVGVKVGANHMTSYLVTARHAIDKWEGIEHGFQARGQDGKLLTIWIPTDSKWWRHPTESDKVDAAVLPVGHLEEADYRSIPLSMFLTDEVRHRVCIGPANEVSILGLFTRLGGIEHLPIVRTGNISAMPNEPIPGVKIGDKHTEAEMYLVEVRSMGGLSGSPVIVHEELSITELGLKTKGRDDDSTQNLVVNTTTMWLLGLMHGHWNLRPEEHNLPNWQATTDNDKSIALGISLVVPAKKILEIINQPELVNQRKEMEYAIRAKLGTTSTE